MPEVETNLMRADADASLEIGKHGPSSRRNGILTPFAATPRGLRGDDWRTKDEAT
ncbi:hypothetical protein RGR602_PC00644 (plasmid) [Rhizobium gallicum bv. gallicum R602sp]|uniref:Uncharacterized protein n=1 Tax=Rhizobium gallicum bv. gallicum R602sp TaxID=1041138 RepID=A0A0B4XDU5_9HYPH|nr:hypothetical protein RGR602_PC00644 [Rhizobium gallicum bv. gallicum R602sp]